MPASKLTLSILVLCSACAVDSMQDPIDGATAGGSTSEGSPAPGSGGSTSSSPDAETGDTTGGEDPEIGSSGPGPDGGDSSGTSGGPSDTGGAPMGTIEERPDLECSSPGAGQAGATCMVVEVSCPELEPAIAELQMYAPQGPSLGTVIFGSGASGSSFYPSPDLLRELSQAGYLVIARAWPDGWPHQSTGYIPSACRYATLSTWIADTLHEGGGFCASGNSGGAAELGYALNYYDRDTLFDLVVPTGGPVAARWDHACDGDDDPQWQHECTDILPDGFCGGAAPCALGPTHGSCSADLTAEERYADSVVGPEADLDYGSTAAVFMQGLNDCEFANVAVGLTWHEAVTSSKSLVFLEDTPHEVYNTQVGRDAIRDAILGGCVPD